MKIGVLGGTFDPVHLGHISMAEAAREALALAEVLLVPAGQPMSRVNRAITTAEHRLNMLRLAVQGKPGLVVSTIEIERPGPTYTVDTLAALHRQYGAEADIYFILGWDSLAQLPEWREPARIIKMCRLAAVPRPGYPQPNTKALERDIPGIKEKVIFLEKPHIDISATMIKETIARGRSIEHLVPGPVAAYIKKHKLYMTAGGKT
jgi:nicotinate-nucleotide adenylyltransferase